MEDDVNRAATVLVRDYIRVKRGDNVVVYADNGSDPAVVEATVEAVKARGGEPLEVWYRIDGPPGTEPPEPMARAMTAADILIEYARTYLITTKAFEKAMEAGARHLCLTAMDRDMMVRTIGNVSLPAMKAFGSALRRLTEGAKDVRVTSPAGTDLRFSIRSRPVILDTGECVVPGRDCYLGGQISWAAIESSIVGTLVLDGTVWPPDETAPLKEPIRIEVNRGRVTQIDGGPSGRILSDWMRRFRDRRMYNVAHFCYGFNPGARISGRILEDERAFGVFVTGFGSQMASFKGGFTLAASHADGVTLRPTVFVDGDAVERDGSFTHPRLRPLAERLRTERPRGSV
jgi:2,5-dihydroxypyridine 5,6-dioxygenase